MSVVSSLARKLGQLKLHAAGAAFAIALSAIACLALPAPANAVTFTPQTPLALFHFSGSRPQDLGIKDGQLKACPTSPNCVSSQASDPEHFIEAIATSDPDATFARIAELVAADDAAEIVTKDDDYLYAEYTSKLMGFVDDVEFWIDRDASEIAVRSASRLGESDLGVNRQRVEAIRKAL